MKRRPGFTLIELLIVVVIIGILASIAIPKFQSTKGKAISATLKSDLRNLVTSQEAYMYEHSQYAPNLSQLTYSASTGVSVSITAATPGGWAATATHPAASPGTCAVFFGSVTPPSPATVEGVIACQ